jgi:exoribonuclease-2
VNILYEDNGSFKVASILTESEGALHVEALHGKRAKVKAKDVLLRFDQPSPGELLERAEASAAEIDTDFLWECCGGEEFGFAELAREYCGKPPSPLEAAGILVKLHSAPMYFYRKGRGRYRAAPPDTLRAALAGLERRRLQEQQIAQWAEQLQGGALPAEFTPLLDELLYGTDRSRPEARAVERACEKTGLSLPRLIERAGALPSTRDFHVRRFLFRHFPKGTDTQVSLDLSDVAHLPLANVEAFSIDDTGTTEIDDALSLTPQPDGCLRVGIHIAAPGLGIVPGSPLEALARARLSTVYMPGAKITMLPAQAVEQFTLAAGRDCPALSLYLDLRPDDFRVERRHTCLERVPIKANLRLPDIAALDDAFLAGQPLPDRPYAAELFSLWRIATVFEQGRGKASPTPERPEYSFYVENDRVVITERKRGTPLDKLVAEMMIMANSTWGKLLDDNGYAAIYRVQGNGKVRMTTAAGPHVGLGTTHYAWSSSPLRRYVDLVNQWQLLALVNQQPAVFERNSDVLLAAMHDFEVTHAAYDEFQRGMERYWCLRWLRQEDVKITAGQVWRENLVKIERLPLILRVPSLPALAPGARVELEIQDIDFLDLDVKCAFVRELSS